MKDVIEILLNKNYNLNFFLFDENGNKMEFKQLAMIPLKDELYFLLLPVSKIKGVSEEEVVIVKYVEINGNDDIMIVTDDNIGNQIINNYYELLKRWWISCGISSKEPFILQV